MDLWIRSQDKTKLTKVDMLTITENHNESIKEENFTFDIEDRFTLGKYKTKARAIEILDDIQDILMPKYVFRFDDKNTIKQLADVYKVQNEPYVSAYNNAEIVNVNQTFVYEMPQE